MLWTRSRLGHVVHIQSQLLPFGPRMQDIKPAASQVRWRSARERKQLLSNLCPLLLVASLFLVVRPGAPSSFLAQFVAMPFASSSEHSPNGVSGSDLTRLTLYMRSSRSIHIETRKTFGMRKLSEIPMHLLGI